MDNLFTRSKLNPIMRPNPDNWWEAKKLYNPGAIFYNGKYHLFYRAMGGGKDWKSSIGYAVSKDGENFQRFTKPLMMGAGKTETRGLEDPRIAKIGKMFYAAYTAYDGKTARLNIAMSKDLKKWEKRGFAFSGWNFGKAVGICFDRNGRPHKKLKPAEWSKSGGIFPEKINGKFWMLFGDYEIWFAVSNDGMQWVADSTPFLTQRQGDRFDNTFVEMGPPPIKTKKGWLVLYHGINDRHWYKIGFLLLDLNNPRKIIFRSKEPIFGPEKKYEMSGIVDVLHGGLKIMQKMSELELKNFLAENEAKGIMPKVTFCCGATVVNNILRIYYGASDSVICTATANLNDILKIAQ